MSCLTYTAPESITKAETSGTYTAVLWKTTEADRHGDAIAAEQFNTSEYEKNPIVLWAHDHAEPVGKAHSVWQEGDELRASFSFGSSARALEVAENVKAGILNAVSVGFRALGDGVLELLEFSIVSVPANAAALIQRSQEGEPMEPATETTPVLEAPAIIEAKPKTYNLAAALAGQAGIGTADDGYERETSQELQHKTGKSDFQVPLTALLSTKAHDTSAGAGAELTAESQRDDLYAEIGDAIRDAMVTGRAGVQTVVEENESASVPVMTQGLTPAWIAKDADAPDTSATFDASQVTPKHVAGLFEIKRSALNYAMHPQISPILQDDLRRAVAHELDRVVLVGDSTANALEPAGITHEVATSGDLDTVADLMGMITGVAEYDEARGDQVRVLTRQSVLDVLSQKPMGAGLTQPAHMLGSGNVFGRSALTTKALTDDANRAITIAGLFSEALLFMFGPSMSVTMNPWGETFKNGGVQGRLIVDANVLIRATGAFAWGSVPVVMSPTAQSVGTSKQGK